MNDPLEPIARNLHSSNHDSQVSPAATHSRKCRDVAFLILFMAFWVAMIVNGSLALSWSNPLWLIHGLDYKGNTCGDEDANPKLSDLQVRYWLNPNQVYQSGLKHSKFKLTDARAICLMECPTPSDDGLKWICDYPEGNIQLSVDEWINKNYDYYDSLTSEMRNSSLQLQGPCYPVIFPSVNVYWSCQFIVRASNVSLQLWQQKGGISINEDLLIDKTIHRDLNSHSAVIKRYLGDIGKTWPVLFVCGAIVPLFLSLIWLTMIRYFVIGMPWITIILFNVLLISVTMLFYVKAGWIGNDSLSVIIGESDPYYRISGREINHLRAIAVLMTSVMVLGILSSIAVVRRVLKATSVLKVAAEVIRDVRDIIIFPLIPYGFLVFFFIFWFSTLLNLCSSGQVAQNACESVNCCAYDLKINKVNCDSCCGYSVHYTHHIMIAILFHIFAGYWVTQFFIACSSTIIAGSVATYYWASIQSVRKIRFVQVFSAARHLLLYNLGSVVIGSLLVSAVESVRSFLEWIRRKLKPMNLAHNSKIGPLILASSRCCLGAVNWIIRSVNRDAYITIAVTGKGFFRASSMARDLIMNNIQRIGKVHAIVDVILFLGRLCVCLSCIVFAFLMMETHKYKSAHNKISSPFFPILACWMLGYVVAALFFSVVELSIDTLILSYCEDCLQHHGMARYAPTILAETLNDHEETQRLSDGS